MTFWMPLAVHPCWLVNWRLLVTELFLFCFETSVRRKITKACCFLFWVGLARRSGHFVKLDNGVSEAALLVIYSLAMFLWERLKKLRGSVGRMGPTDRPSYRNAGMHRKIRLFTAFPGFHLLKKKNMKALRS